MGAYEPILEAITYAFQDENLVSLIAKVLALSHIEPDPALHEVGLLMMFEGDFLNPHLDNSHDGKRNRYQRLNLLYYVSPDWILENGGNLELWDTSLKNATTILSKTNRLIVMETNKTTWHSVSPLKALRLRTCF